MKGRRRISVLLSAALLMSAQGTFAMAEAVPEETEAWTAEAVPEETEAWTAEAAPGETETEDPMAWYHEYTSRTLEDLETVQEGETTISTRKYPCYLITDENCFDLPLYFINNVTDLPYIEMKDLCNVLTTAYAEVIGDAGCSFYLEEDGPVVQLSRENGYSLLIDFEKGTLTFDDYDAFLHRSAETFLLESVSTLVLDEKGNELLLKRNEKGSFDRYGKEVEIRLADYDIDLYMSEDQELYLIPLQTMSDLLLSPRCLITAGFNEQAVFLASYEDIMSPLGLTRLGMMYGSGPSGDMSPELADYSYHELCLAMDKLYGLKELHGISSFDELFTEIGYKEMLQSTDPDVKDGALSDFIMFYLDDLHSGLNIGSFRSIEPKSRKGFGLSVRRTIADENKYSKARGDEEKGIPAYEEIGNTAFITFDHFNIPKTVEAYYNGEYAQNAGDYDVADPGIDTIGLILYAHQQITRPDSPIENVVMDLSMNGGGEIDAAVVVASWFLGETEVSMQSSLTGARSTSLYQADINLDGKYDEKDTVADRNLYCLVSPNSFSCGNLLPAVFKHSHNVTIVGQTSGGGSCSVLELTSAWGAFFQISSPYNLSYVKNGSYYEIDSGVEPDYCINKPADFFNREALADYLNGLF